MLVNNPMGESIGAVRWCLAGSVTTPAPLTMMGHSVKLIRCFDGLSPRIRLAMNAKSTVPVVEITTPDAKLTLAGARIVKIVPVPRKGRPHGHSHFELEEIELTFASITHSGKGGKKGMSDNWSSGG